jgi:hypothetical protein
MHLWLFITLPTESQTGQKQSRGFFELFYVKWKFQGDVAEGITDGLILNNNI